MHTSVSPHLATHPHLPSPSLACLQPQHHSMPLPRRRKVESFDAEQAGTVELDPSKREALDADPLARLEHSGEDKRKALATYTQIAALQEDSAAKHK